MDFDRVRPKPAGGLRCLRTQREPASGRIEAGSGGLPVPRGSCGFVLADDRLRAQAMPQGFHPGARKRGLLAGGSATGCETCPVSPDIRRMELSISGSESGARHCLASSGIVVSDPIRCGREPLELYRSERASRPERSVGSGRASRHPFPSRSERLQLSPRQCPPDRAASPRHRPHPR